MKKLLILAGLCLYTLPAAAGLVFHTEPFDYRDFPMPPPHIADISVLSSGPTEFIGGFTVGLRPDGFYELLDVDYPPGWTFTDWGLNAFGDGFHYWDLYNDASPSPIPPATELLRLTINFPQVVSVFELCLYDQDFNRIEDVFFVVAPEPATFFLLALGAFLAGRKRRMVQRVEEKKIVIYR
jgi:hypothetical protein